jgi:mono/diheme cytochrome c family protein
MIRTGLIRGCTCVVTVALALMLSGCTQPKPTNPFAGDAAGIKRGQSIFVGSCGGYCHGTTPGPRDAPFLFDCVWLHGGEDEDLFKVISEGVPSTRMVSFGGSLPQGDNDIWRVVAFIKAAGPKDC